MKTRNVGGNFGLEISNLRLENSKKRSSDARDSKSGAYTDSSGSLRSRGRSSWAVEHRVAHRIRSAAISGVLSGSGPCR